MTRTTGGSSYQVVDAKAARVRCPTCDYPLRLDVTICHICGGRVDPREQFERYERETTTR